MKFSRKGKELLIKSEGAVPKVYDDAASTSEKRAGLVSYESSIGYPTIGVGHLIYHPRIGVDQRERFRKYLRGGETMTENQMIRLLDEDLPKYVKPIKDAIKVPVTQEMFDALVHMAFNVGPNSYAIRDAVAFVNEKDWQSAAEAIRNGPKTSKGKVLPGLVKRRNMEADWFLSGGEPNALSVVQAGLGNLQGIGSVFLILALAAGTAYGAYHLRQLRLQELGEE